MARQQQAAAAALPTLNAKRRRRVRLGSTAVLLTLIAFIGFANLYIHRVFQLQQQRMAPQQQANTNARQQQSNNWKPPSTDRFAATKEKEHAVKDDPAKISPSAALPVDADDHPLAGLDCTPHGGPDNEKAAEMVFWEDIESDSKYKSPFLRDDGPTQYLTFEPDHGGWNNIRMAMETTLVMAHAMGRT